MTRPFLGIVALVLVGYGVACALDPTLPARLAGLAILNGDGYAEMGAMYGGLQIGVGAFAVLGIVKPDLTRPALLLLLLTLGPLAAMRGLSALRTEDAISTYTWGALVFECLVTAFAALLVRRQAP